MLARGPAAFVAQIKRANLVFAPFNSVRRRFGPYRPESAA